MSVVLLGSTSGSVTLQEPAVAGSTTINLPATSGTMAVLPTATSVLPEASGGTGTTTGYYGFKNRIINGAMVIDQRNAGASVTVNNLAIFYGVDRFRAVGQSAAGVFTMQQVSDAPAGFVNSLKITVTTADASIAASDRYLYQQVIEGNNVADLGFGTANASTVTISFWVKSSLTGTFGACLQNDATNRSYPFSYVINSANTWEQKTVTIAGDTTGTWVTNNTGWGRVNWSMGNGSTFTSTANSWQASNYEGVNGQVQPISTLNATWQVTGVQLEKGSTATSFDYRPYGTELALCQRYYQRYGDATTSKFVGSLGVAPSSAEYDMCFPLTGAMRSAPTMNYANMQITDGAGNNFTPSSITTYQATTTTAGFYMNATGLTAYRPYFLRTSSSAGYLDASSEL